MAASDAPAKKCACSPEFEAEFGDMFHDPYGCPLASNCGGQTSDPPCGGCDRCQLDMAAYYASMRPIEDIELPDTPTTRTETA